jgi:tetratricopeptide (TPR) repeat protein
VVSAHGPEFDRARKLYLLTDFEGSLRILQSIPAKDPEVVGLIGRNYYMQGEYKKASEALEKAATSEPDNSEIALWAARAFGRRAETSSPFTAPGFATRARQYFEKSVQLNPKNLDALTDLFEYYLEAPGFLGGGHDKAERTAARIAELDAGEGFWCQAKLAEKRKELGGAEQHLRQALAASPRQIGRFIDLARFLARHGRLKESDETFAKAAEINAASPKLLFAEADVYIKTNRRLDEARVLLNRYLASAITPDDPPRSQAEKLLKQLGG